MSITTHDLTNNDSIVTGIIRDGEAFHAMTLTQSKTFKTEAGAVRWLARWGYTAEGGRAR